MKKQLFKFCAIVISIIALGSTVGCGSKNNFGTADTIDTNYQWLDASIKDTSDLDSYSGKNQMKLTAWNTMGGSALNKTASNDVVTPEITRITGVEITKVMNAGDADPMSEWEKIVISKDIPQIAYGNINCIENVDRFDLTDLVKKYCPTLMERVPKSVWKNLYAEDGRLYQLPWNIHSGSIANIVPEDVAAMPEGHSTIMFDEDNDYYPYVLVREDVLKAAYPNAHTQAELEEIFNTRGYFTEKELFDVEITSAEKFRTEFLPAISAVLANNNYYVEKSTGRSVATMVLDNGNDYDTWDFMGVLIPKLLGGTGNHKNTHFSYWDVNTQKVEMMMTQDFYKREVYEWAKLLAEGKLVSKDGFYSSHNDFMSYLNRGLYAIAYGSNTSPAGNTIKWESADGTTSNVTYRKVYMKIEKADQFEYWSNAIPSATGLCFIKGSGLKEEHLPQILRWIDYQASRLADKMYSWGPRSAGLFTEDANGNRTFKDAELANQMVYSTGAQGNLVEKYNLSNGSQYAVEPYFPLMYRGMSVDHAKCSYDLSSLVGMAAKYYTPTAITPKESKPLVQFADMSHGWTNEMCPGVEVMWAGRPDIETALENLLKSGSTKAAYESAYTNLLQTLASKGWTKSFFNGAFTNAFLKENKDYVSYFLK